MDVVLAVVGGPGTPAALPQASRSKAQSASAIPERIWEMMPDP